MVNFLNSYYVHYTGGGRNTSYIVNSHLSSASEHRQVVMVDKKIDTAMVACSHKPEGHQFIGGHVIW